MARNRHRKSKRSLKLPLAGLSTLLAMLMLYLVTAGHIYNATQGAEVGLYVTIGALLLGFGFAGTAIVLAISVVASGRRRVDNVLEVDRSRQAKPRKAA